MPEALVNWEVVKLQISCDERNHGKLQKSRDEIIACRDVLSNDLRIINQEIKKLINKDEKNPPDLELMYENMQAVEHLIKEKEKVDKEFSFGLDLKNLVAEGKNDKEILENAQNQAEELQHACDRAKEDIQYVLREKADTIQLDTHLMMTIVDMLRRMSDRLHRCGERMTNAQRG